MPRQRVADTSSAETGSSATETLGSHGIAAVIEPINPHMGIVANGELYTTYGMRGFYLTSTAQAIEAIEAVNHPNLHLHLDIYHIQMTEGRIAETLRAAAGRTSGSGQLKHLQIASVPGRKRTGWRRDQLSLFVRSDR